MKRVKLPQKYAGFMLATIQRFALTVGIVFVPLNTHATFYDTTREASITKQDTLTNRTEAEFPGGMEALTKYLQIDIEYPILPEEHGIKGITTVKLVIDKNGEVKYPRILRSVDPILDRMALEQVWKMPSWIPATENGKAVPCDIVVPIRYIRHYIPYKEFKDKEEYSLKAERSTPVYGKKGDIQPDTQPEYPGGIKKLLEDMGIYAKEMWERIGNPLGGIPPLGWTTVGFIIEKDGCISNIEILHTQDSGLEKEAIRFIKSLPRWTPGTKDGKMVRTYVIPVSFQTR